MNNPLENSAKRFLALLLFVSLFVSTRAERGFYANNDHFHRDTVPETSIFRKIGNYMDSLKNRRYRDSVLQKITRHDDTVVVEDNSMQKK